MGCTELRLGRACALVAAVLVGGCQVSLPPDLTIECVAPDNACPPGYECESGVCVQRRSDDAGAQDTSGDARLDGGPPPPDAGPVDADAGEDVELGEDSGPDAGPDAGPPPPPPMVAVIGGPGTQTVDGIAVSGESIYVVGTYAGPEFCLGSGNRRSCSEAEEGMYVVDFERDLSVRAVSFFNGPDIIPAGIGLIADEGVVVGGTHSGVISNTEPPIDAPTVGEVGAFVLTLGEVGQNQASSVGWSLGSDGSMLDLDSQGETWCAVGLSGINPGEPGYLTCGTPGGVPTEFGLCDGAANHLDMSNETWQVAWSLCGEPPRATAVSFDAGSGLMNYRTDEELGTTGELVASNGRDVVLVSRESERSFRVLAGIREDSSPGMGTGQTYVAALGAAGPGTVSLRDMAVTDDRKVHVVGELVGQGTRLLSGLEADSGRGFYAAISAPLDARVESLGGGNSDFRAIAAIEGTIVIGGQGLGPLTFMEGPLLDLDPDNLDGFIMLIPEVP